MVLNANAGRNIRAAFSRKIHMPANIIILLKVFSVYLEKMSPLDFNYIYYATLEGGNVVNKKGSEKM